MAGKHQLTDHYLEFLVIFLLHTEGYTICYLDESALSPFPSRTTTYAPKGRTPTAPRGNPRGGVQAVSLVTPSGKLYYQVKEGGFPLLGD